MSSSSKLNRRTFVAGQAALATAAALPTAVAASATTETAATAATRARAAACGPAHWHSATAVELRQFIGDRFRVQTRDHGSVVLRLSAVEPIHSGAARPKSLPRSEGVIAVFDSPDMAPLVEIGHDTHRVRHARLGQADLFMGPSPRRDGSHVIELILN